jgi:hypothetical protein
MKTFCHERSRLVTLCNELLYIISFDLYTVLWFFLMQPYKLCVRLVCFFMLEYARLIYIMLCRLAINGHNSLSLTSLSLLHRFSNVLHIWSLIVLLNTFWHEWLGLVTLCNQLLYITINLIPFIPCSVYKSNCSRFSYYFYSPVLRTNSYAFRLPKRHPQWVQSYAITYASLVHNKHHSFVYKKCIKRKVT